MIRDEAICVRQWDWSETSQTVSLFTRGHGLLRCIVKGARRDKAPFSGGLEILTRGELTAILKKTGSLSTLTAWDLRHTHRGIRQDYTRFGVGVLIADLTHLCLEEHDPHTGLYDSLASELLVLGDPGAEASPMAILLGSLWALVTEIGLAPQVGRLPRAEPFAWFSSGSGTVIPRSAGAGRSAPTSDAWKVRTETIGLLAEAAENADLGGYSDEALRRACRLLVQHLSERLDVTPASVGMVLGGMPSRGSSSPGNP